MVKIVKQEYEISDTRLMFSIKHFSFDFIELFNSSLRQLDTPFFIQNIIKFDFSIWFLVAIVSIITTIFCLVIIAFILFWKYSVSGFQPTFNGASKRSSNKLQNLDYDKIPIQKIQFSLTVFYGDVLFELLSLLPNFHGFSKMQGMDRKKDGHAQCKVITTNIKNNFGLNFKKTCCLGHLCCVQDDCEIFVRFAFHNGTFRCSENIHILVVGQL